MKGILFFAVFITILFGFACWWLLSMACKPISYFWTAFNDPDTGRCFDWKRFFISVSIMNLMTEFIIFIIPFPRIIRLQMGIKRKLSILGLMAVGIS